MDPITTVKERMAALLTERATAHKSQEDVLTRCKSETRDANETEAVEVRAAADRKSAIDAELDECRTRLASLEDEARRDTAAAELRKSLGQTENRSAGRVTNEPKTYTQESNRSGVSYFSDAYAAQMNPGAMDSRTAERLQRYGRELEVETRATTTGSYAGLVIPQYLVDLAALALRNGRPLANAVQRLPLPDEGMSLIVPRGTTGAATAIQATENATTQLTDEVWTNLTVPVVTIAGQAAVSRQSLERGTPGMDGIIFLDLAGAYAANLDTQLINGSGAAGQILGILNTSGISAATAYGAAVTAALFTSKVAGQIQAIAGAGTAIQPRVIVMHPRRWGWLQSLSDTTGRPLGIATAVPQFNAALAVTQPGAYSGDGPATGEGGPQFVGIMANGLPVITDANIPTNVGTLTEDVVLVLDTQQVFLWEKASAPTQLKFEQTAGQNLTTTLVAYGYAAATAGRYPGAVGKIGGLDVTGGFGQIAPTF